MHSNVGGCIRDASECIRCAFGMHGGGGKDALGSVVRRNAFELFVYIANGVRGSFRGCSRDKKIVKFVKIVGILRKIVKIVEIVRILRKIVKIVKILEKIVEEDCREVCSGIRVRDDSEDSYNDCADCCSGSSARGSSEDW